MFEIKKQGNLSVEAKLLYNIWQEQIKTNELLEKANEPIDYALEPRNQDQISEKIETFKCKYCDKTFDNKFKLMAHYKAHKKESGNDPLLPSYPTLLVREIVLPCGTSRRARAPQGQSYL